MSNKSGKEDQKSYSELERIETKYIFNKVDLLAIQAEVEKHLSPAYPNKKTKYVLINTIYLDSPTLDFFKFHSYQMNERIKVRIRKYGSDGIWDKNHYLEIKEKDHEDVKKYRIQLDNKNVDNVKKGLNLEFNRELEELNSPLYTHTDLKRYIEKYNKIVLKNEITPVLAVNYKRLAYGEGALRVTIDQNISYKKDRIISLSTAQKIKRAVDWGEAKKYIKRYSPQENAILEIKHNSENLPEWLQALLDTYNIKEVKFSKYVYSAASLLKEIVGD